MDHYIEQLLDEEKIGMRGSVPFSAVRVINPSLTERYLPGREVKSVIVFLVPYYTGEYPERNISLYAVPRDYHLYFRELFSRLEPRLSEHFPGFAFKGFADHSPIGETGAAALAGLGVIGDKFQLINGTYGSHVFIGEILTDMPFPAYDIHEVGFCSHCGACSRACPVSAGCLSEMTQRKGEAEPETVRLIRKTGIAWGCDLCRTSCPMNRDIRETPIDFFRRDLITVLTPEQVEQMPKREFETRAFAWRGKKTILRNLCILYGKDKP